MGEHAERAKSRRPLRLANAVSPASIMREIEHGEVLTIAILSANLVMDSHSSNLNSKNLKPEF
jgi:hypothetical protein